MARSSEKAMTALARWRQAKMSEEGLDKKNERRPYLASECNDLKDAERFRLQIVREVSKKVASIQNAGLGEYRLRDLNDSINKLLREKRHWEHRIVELGGRDMRRRSRMIDNQGRELPGSFGYKYFGAARDLPGVRELFEQAGPVNTRKTRAELVKDIDAGYFGFMDDEEERRLLPNEIVQEKKARLEAHKAWLEKKKTTNHPLDEEQKLMNEEGNEEQDLEEALKVGRADQRYELRLKVPTRTDVEAALLRRRKAELVQAFALDEFEDEEDAVQEDSKKGENSKRDVDTDKKEDSVKKEVETLNSNKEEVKTAKTEEGKKSS